MKLRAIKSWRRLKPGDAVELPDGVANVLIRRKIAVIDTPREPKTRRR